MTQNTTPTLSSDILTPPASETLATKVKDFSELLEEIESLNDKKKKLWCEIYSNAITDRQNAYALWFELCLIVNNKSAEHAIHGRTMTAFLERMSKSNEQLIRLAELIAKAENKSDDLDPELLFEKINKK